MQMWIQILLRTTGLFIITFVLIRLMGKKNMARMTPFYFVSYIVIAVLAALISANVIINLVYGFIAMGVWVILPIILDYLSIKSKVFHDFFLGKEDVLIKHGKIMEDNLMKTRLTGEELLSELRHKNVFNLADVEFAVMETTGEINIFLKSDKMPLSAKDMNIKKAPISEPQTIILDGNVMNEPLASLGLNKEWLRIQLENTGVSLDNVFLGQVDSSGDLYFDLFDDAVELPQPKVKEMVYANIEKAQASLMTFSLETKDEMAKEVYIRDAEKLRDVMNKLEPFLLR